MKKKPFSIQLIAFCFLLAPVGNILQIAYFNQWPLHGNRGVLNHLSWYEWSVLAAFPIVAFGIWRVAKWGYFLCMAFAVFLVVSNTYAYFTNHAYSPYIVLLFQLVTFAIVGFFVQKHVQAPYFNPKIRWWENDPRYPVNLTAELRQEQYFQTCSIVDISAGGCFAESKKEFNLGEMVWITVHLDDTHFTCQGKIVWVRKEPRLGYGLMFETMDTVEEKKLRDLIKQLRAASKKSVAGASKKSDSISA